MAMSGTTTPMSIDDWVRSERAEMLGVKPSSVATSRTRWRVLAGILGWPSSARLTVDRETPAAAATSARVGRRPGTAAGRPALSSGCAAGLMLPRPSSAGPREDPAAVHDGVDDGGKAKDQALGDVLRRRGRTEQVQAVRQRLDQQGADQRSPDVSPATEQAGAADDRGRDGDEQKVRGVGVHPDPENPGGTQDPGGRREEPVDGEGRQEHLPGRYPGPVGR